MEHLSFTLWLVLYPIATSIETYLSAKEKKLHNEPPYSKEVKGGAAVIRMIIYILVAGLLY